VPRGPRRDILSRTSRRPETSDMVELLLLSQRRLHAEQQLDVPDHLGGLVGLAQERPFATPSAFSATMT
jgi:hypothetical protein